VTQANNVHLRTGKAGQEEVFSQSITAFESRRAPPVRLGIRLSCRLAVNKKARSERPGRRLSFFEAQLYLRGVTCLYFWGWFFVQPQQRRVTVPVSLP
jgi:hypothetical protein